MAVMGVTLQWDSHTKTREGQLWGPSKVLKDGPGMGNDASLKSSCYRISVMCPLIVANVNPIPTKWFLAGK